MQEHLILTIRLQALESNVSRVQALLDDLRERKELVDGVGTALQGAHSHMIQVSEDLFSLSFRVRRGESITSAELQKLALASQQKCDELEPTLAAVTRLQALCRELRPADIDMRIGISGALHAGVEMGPESYAKILPTARKKILELLLQKPEEAWREYHEELYIKARNLFSDYVQVLAGLALRDTELDRKICWFADHLLRLFSFAATPQEQMLTIPTRQDAVRMTWSRVVRLGFPEWTIWALPFTAHELWFAIARNKLKPEPLIERTDGRVELCLADAFATWSMGPAYAYAAILLQLNPWKATVNGVDHPADDDRVAAILRMLELMDSGGHSGNGGGIRRYAHVRAVLETAWSEAKLLPRQKIEPAPELAPSLDALYQRLEEDLRSSGFRVEHWDRIQSWPDKLRAGSSDVSELATAEMKWVLNAAWMTRVEDIGKTADIEKAAREVLDKLLTPESARRVGAPRPGGM